MSPSFVNDNAHPVRVKSGVRGNGDSILERIRPGEVVEADGAYADALSKVPGVTTASSEDERAFEKENEARERESSMPGRAARQEAKAGVGDARVLLRNAITAAPLRRVVGDDQAPVGPPSGTITTKGEVVDGAEPGSALRRAFGPNEARSGERVDGAGEPPPGLPGAAVVSGAEIHNAQVSNAEQAEQFAQELVETGDPLDLGEDNDDDTSGDNDKGSGSEPLGFDTGAQGSLSGDLSGANFADLQAEAKRRNVEVEGTGKDGAVKKADLVAALEADNEKE